MLGSSIFIAAIVLIQMYLGSSQTIMIADFIDSPVETGMIAWNNYIGFVMNYSQILPYYNATLLQGYLLNFNLKANYRNKLSCTLRMPKGWFYQCANGGYLSTDTTHCIRELKTNTTFFNELGQFYNRILNPPFWNLGLNNQMIDFTNLDTQQSIYNFIVEILNLNLRGFIFQMMYEGDKAIQNGMRSGAQYTPTMFFEENYYYEEIFYGINYKAPGMTENANIQWFNIDDFQSNVWKGIFTFEPVIFIDPSLATIQNLLSDNYTKGYLLRRARLNSSFTYSDFDASASLAKTRLVPGEGIDGITNTFAAALWWLDFIIQSVLFNFYDVSIEGATRAGNYQSVFGPSPDFAPTSLYYATLMAVLAIDSQPQIIIPKYQSVSSEKIKVWGLKTSEVMKFLIINKDKNSSLVGSVNILIESDQNSRIDCISMEASSLTSKADNMTIAGYYFIGGNSTPQGYFTPIYFQYDRQIDGFPVRIKHAQALLCEVKMSTYVIPKKSCTSSQKQSTYYLILAFVIFLFTF